MSEQELSWFCAALDHEIAPSQESDESFVARFINELNREEA